MGIAEDIITKRNQKRDVVRDANRAIAQATHSGERAADTTIALHTWHTIRSTVFELLEYLAANEYRGGVLHPIVTAYHPMRTWYGKRFHGRTTEELAVWGIEACFTQIRGNYCTCRIYFGSNGNLYADNFVPDYYYDRRSKRWGCKNVLHLIDEQSKIPLGTLERILQDLFKMRSQ